MATNSSFNIVNSHLTVPLQIFDWQNTDDSDYARRATIAFAFRLMLTGRPELLKQAMALLPTTTRYDTRNHAGLTALMIAAIHNDDAVLKALLDAGANPNIEVQSSGPGAVCTNVIHPETQHWTALTFAACRGNYAAVRLLLQRGTFGPNAMDRIIFLVLL